MAPAGGAPLSVRELPALLERVYAALERRRASIDDLNVFPVPDGDTGTNMTLTVRAGCDALREAADVTSPQAAGDVVRAVVGGARGNSGVILSQVIRAVVDVVDGQRQVDAQLFAEALAAARDLAYEAIAEPVEGTMLTAIRVAADAAQQAVDAGADLVVTSQQTFDAVAAIVEETPNMLAVLRQAGVVDAGARGFEVVLAAVHGHLTGAEPEVVEDHPRPLGQLAATGCVETSPTAFEVQYLVDADDSVARDLRRGLEGLGDSVAVVAAGGVLNVHIHTDDVGAAIEVGTRFGVPTNIQVAHFGDQIARRTAEQRLALGAVAVMNGDGVAALVRAHGVVVVPGAGGELPSVDDLYRGIKATAARHVVLLPGHRHSVAAAHQAAEIAANTDAVVVDVVTAATTPVATLAAVALFDPERDPDEVRDLLDDAAQGVRALEIVSAVRDSQTPHGPVDAGQLLVVRGDGRVVAVADEIGDTFAAVSAELALDTAEVITVLVGTDVNAAEVAALDDAIRAAGPQADVDVIDGGVAPARFWIGAE